MRKKQACQAGVNLLIDGDQRWAFMSSTIKPTRNEKDFMCFWVVIADYAYSYIHCIEFWLVGESDLEAELNGTSSTRSKRNQDYS